MIRSIVIGALFLILTPGMVSSESALSLSDLESLSKKGLEAEVLEKLEQIPGAERDKRWDRLLFQASKARLEQEKKLATDASLRNVATLFQRYPQLQASTEHSELVGQGLSDWFEHCHDSHLLKTCVSNLAVILSTVQPFADTKALHLLVHDIASKDAVLAFPLYNLLVKEFEEEGLCGEKMFAHSILATLESEAPDKDIDLAKEYLSGSCSKFILQTLPSELKTSGKRFQERVCPVLIKARLLSNLQKKRCERILEEAS